MILIDSLYINNSGGLRLLKYLINTLHNCDFDFYLLADQRTEGLFDAERNIEYMEASIWKRTFFYYKHKNEFTSVLCFGNVPPPIKLRIPVYTYFHNVNRLNVTVNYSKKNILLSWLKRAYIKSLKQNTVKWIVQTTYTKSELMKYFNESDEKVLIMPFFELPNDKRRSDIVPKDYCFIGAYTGNKGHDELLEAWSILHKQGIRLVLHLTVDNTNLAFKELEKRYDFKELGVINHGLIPFKSVIELYHQSRAIIYPSKNESLGLGLVEAIHYGCDVISSDLPFTYSVCNPSEVFNPLSPESVANAVIRYEKGKSPRSVLTIANKIDDLVELIGKQ